MEIHDATFIAGATHLKQMPPPAFAEIAFAGRSNVGKSSLINAMVARKRLVRTSSKPGCTRAINIFRVRTRDAVLDFVDLPGYGYAQRSKAERASWGPLIEGFLRERPGLRSVVVIIDIRRGLQDDDRQLLDFIEATKSSALVVATKLDKIPRSKQRSVLQKLQRDAGVALYGFSSVTKVGRDELWRTILREASIGHREA